MDIFKLSETIIQDFLKIDNSENSLFQERSEEILNKLQKYYIDEGCEINSESECEKQFILRSLPYISSVVQLTSTIRDFNEAMEQVKKIYNLEDKIFDQARILSYLVFVFFVAKGKAQFSQDTKELEYKTISKEGIKTSRTIERNALWNEICYQVENLLKRTLEVPNSGRPGIPWYNLARRYSKQVKDIRKKIKNAETNKTEEDVQKIINKALINLEIAINEEERYKQDAKNDDIFASIKEEERFKELVGKYQKQTLPNL